MKKANISRLAAGLGLGAWLALAPPVGAAPTPPSAPKFVAQSLPPDQTANGPRRPPAAALARLNELGGQREFRYLQVENPPSAWDAFWARFWRWVARWLSSRSYQGFWKWVFYALFIGAAVFVVLKLLQVDLTAAFGRAPRRMALAYDAATENIHEVDFAARLREAEESGNYRLALRLGYLELLKKFSDQGLIDWQPNKTNHAYLRELADSQPVIRPAFGEVTRQFEYVWYGELALPAALYRQAREAQQQVGQQLEPAGRRVAA